MFSVHHALHPTARMVRSPPVGFSVHHAPDCGADGQKETDTFMEIVRAAPSQATFSAMVAR